MRCGRRGCACTTCEECGYDYPCMCSKRERVKKFKQRAQNPEENENGIVHRDEFERLLQEAVELMEDLVE